jgi:putative DNA primase/helicase
MLLLLRLAGVSLCLLGVPTMASAAAVATDFADIDDDSVRAAIGGAAVKAKLPFGYAMKPDGLYFDDGGDNPATRIAGKIEVLAQTRDDLGASWGLLLRWQDGDGREHRWAMPKALLAGDGTDIRSNLLDRGCYVGPSAKARGKLQDFFAMVSIDARARAVDRVGWMDGAFALPDRTIADTDSHRVIYQGPAAFEHAYRIDGDLEGWKTLAAYGVGNSRLAVALSAAFVGPLLDILGEEGGGLNFRGSSSIGKSTALIAAASVWGKPASFVRQWRATSNGLEGVAVQHNETLLCLDELAQLDAKEAGSVAYMLANGQGKARAGRSGAARASASWRVMFLSSGEISLADLAGRDGRGARRSAAGQEVRILDVDADAGAGMGLFERLHDQPNAESLSRAVKELAGTHYGLAGPLFVERVAANRDALARSLKAGMDAFVKANVDAGAAGQVKRAGRRMALIGMAGEVATRLGILPWPQGEATRAAVTVLNVWLAGRGGSGSSEDREAVEKVRAFLEQHGSSRFEPVDRVYDSAAEPKVINRAGFWQTVEGLREYLILPGAWRNEVCAGSNPTAVARALADRGMIAVDSGGKYSILRTLPGLGKTRVYVINSTIFGGDDEDR